MRNLFSSLDFTIKRNRKQNGQLVCSWRYSHYNFQKQIKIMQLGEKGKAKQKNQNQKQQQQQKKKTQEIRRKRCRTCWD